MLKKNTAFGHYVIFSGKKDTASPGRIVPVRLCQGLYQILTAESDKCFSVHVPDPNSVEVILRNKTTNIRSLKDYWYLGGFDELNLEKN